MNSSQKFNLSLQFGPVTGLSWSVDQSNEAVSKRLLELSEEELNDLKKVTVQKNTILNTYKTAVSPTLCQMPNLQLG